MSADDKTKLDGIAAGANAYTHPSYTAKSNGLYKITVDSQGHVSEATAAAKTDITSLGIPAQDTTYDNATTSAAGLMSSDDKTKLNGIAAGAEVNQNAFSNVKVGSTTVSADTKTDTVEFVAGSNVTITPDSTNDKITIAATDTTYSSKAAASGGTDVSLVTTGEKYIWDSKTSNTGTVTKVSTGAGLVGGDITGSGTIKADLRSETKLTTASAAATETSGRVYPVALDKDGKLAVNVP